ncbi:hypothetical protein ACIQCF_36935 [Streptomyces sp. NPDC088353]|uniref:hypothetical protein n=1 Tax=Streptomyces sp. NPDC088353 TaxID=3365855 RepID=UPI003803AAE9
MGRIVPAAVTASPGNFLTGALWNSQVKALNDFLTSPPIFTGYASTAQSIPGANTGTPLNLDTTTIDTENGHSNTTNNSRYTATVPGTYLVFGAVGWSNNTSGDRRLYIARNGSSVAGSGTSFDPSQAVLHGLQTSGICTLNGTTDYVEVFAAHSSTTNPLSTNSGPGVFCAAMSVLWISR